MAVLYLLLVLGVRKDVGVGMGSYASAFRLMHAPNGQSRTALGFAGAL
jgi:hypothetical protein